MIFHNQDTGIPFPSDLASKNFPQLYLFSSASTSMFNIFIILKRILKFAGFVVSLEHSLLTEKKSISWCKLWTAKIQKLENFVSLFHC